MLNTNHSNTCFIMTGTILWLDPPPPPPSLLKGDSAFQKRSHLGKGVQKFLLEQGDKPEKGVWGGVDVEMGDCHFFVTLQFSHIYCVCGESKIPFITFWIFSLLS